MRVLLGVLAIWLMTNVALAPVHAQNFVGIKPDIEKYLEDIRDDLAVEWFGSKAPTWRNPVRVTVVAENGSSVTSYRFQDGWVRPNNMVLRGSSWDSIFNSAKHEIMHLLLAEWVGKPIPRWVDEGLASYVEGNESLWDRANKLHLTTGRGISFNELFSVASNSPYPRDKMAFYTQSESISRFLIKQRGKRDFIDFVNSVANYNVTKALKEHYFYEDSSDLQTKWLSWIRDGMPDVKQQIYVGRC